MKVSHSDFLNDFDLRVFCIGLLLISSLYLACFAWFSFNHASALADLENKLASQTIPILRLAGEITIAPTQEAQPEKHAQPAAKKTEIAKKSTETILAKAPVADLIGESGGYKNLPVIRKSDNLTPFNAYKRPFSPVPGQSYIILVVDGGVSQSLIKDAIKKLPPEISILTSPYSDNLQDLMDTMRADGHEPWLSIPFQTVQFPASDPGPQAILSKSSLDVSMNNLEWSLNQSAGYVGIAGYVDQSFLNARPVMNALVKNAFGRGLGFFDINPSAPDQIEELALQMNTPYVKADNNISDDFKSSFEILEAIAGSKGVAIAVIPPYPVAIKSALEWIESFPSKKLALAPLSVAANVAVAENIDSVQAVEPKMPDEVLHSPKPAIHNAPASHE